ncbi:MAG: TIGR04013 family B12-binding domain/radical SAM domain-containing protein [Clostridiales bacterium]|jgi:B12-binding domain/radical SAM domain protein|nr:TIGR04013 family B12-binding domain/radical SAM domain-containing protein [Clostridiales bacterium]
MVNNAFIERINNLNRNSFNALTGALTSFDMSPDIDIFFWDNEDLSIVDECLNKYNKVVVGFSFFTTNILQAYHTLVAIREKHGNNVICVAGGPHPTGEPKSMLDLGFDYVFVGEGEELINEFFFCLNGGDDISKIKGIYSKTSSGEYIYQPRDTIVDLNKFYPFSDKYKKFGHIEITRGCPFACNFCQTTRIFGCSVRHRNVDFMRELIQILKKNNRQKALRFITPNAFAYGSPDGRVVDLNAIHALLDMIRVEMPGCDIFLGSFPSEVRPEHVTNESMALLASYVKNNNIIMGAQTGSQRLLDISHRGHTVEDIYRAAEISVRFKKKPNIDFIFGLPGETYDDILKTIRVMQDLIKMGAQIHAHTFMPLPQTPFADKSNGRVDSAIKTAIKKYINNGIVYGDWIEQEKISQKIAYYLKTKDISDLE